MDKVNQPKKPLQQNKPQHNKKQGVTVETKATLQQKQPMAHHQEKPPKSNKNDQVKQKHVADEGIDNINNSFLPSKSMELRIREMIEDASNFPKEEHKKTPIDENSDKATIDTTESQQTDSSLTTGDNNNSSDSEEGALQKRLQSDYQRLKELKQKKLQSMLQTQREKDLEKFEIQARMEMEDEIIQVMNAKDRSVNDSQLFLDDIEKKIAEMNKMRDSIQHQITQVERLYSVHLQELQEKCDKKIKEYKDQLTQKYETKIPPPQTQNGTLTSMHTHTHTHNTKPPEKPERTVNKLEVLKKHNKNNKV